MEQIPFLKPKIVNKETYLSYLDKIDDTKIYTNFGPLNRAFENRILNEYFNNYGDVTTVSNATLGLILSISEMKRPNARYAIMPSFTFSATPLAAMWCGLEPYFIEIDNRTWEMNQGEVSEAIKKLGNDVAVVIPYATFGNYIDLSFYERLQNNGIPVVVDAAASFGSTKKNVQFGTKFSGTVVFSFHATKPFGIGEGGLIYSNNMNLISNIRGATNFGYMGNRESMNMGINAKLSEYHAAIGLATLDVFPQKLLARQKLYHLYLEKIKELGLLKKGWELQKVDGEVPYQFFSILCPKWLCNKGILARLKENGVNAATYFSPACHQQAKFKEYQYVNLDTTAEIANRIVSLPLWEGMNSGTIEKILIALEKDERE